MVKALRNLRRQDLSPRFIWMSLIAMIAFVVLVSQYLSAAQSLRLDEAQSLWQTSQPARMYFLIAQDVHVPLYHTFLYLWQVAFGNGVDTVRYMSLLFYALTIPLTYKLGSEAVSRKVGLVAALLVTLSPFMNWYGNEARMYAMLTFATVLNQLFFMRIWKRGGAKNWVLYALSAVFGIYTQYFFSLVLITQGIFYLTHRKYFPAGSLKRFVAVAVTVALAIAPWLYFVASQGFASGTKPQLPKPTTVDLFNTFSQFLFGFQDDLLNTFIVSLWPLTVLLAFLTLQRQRRMEPSILFFVFAAFLPVLFAFVFSLVVRPFYVSRYLIVSLPALYIYLAWVLSVYGRKLQLTVAALLIAGMGFMLTEQITAATNPVKENYQQAAEYLNANATPRDVVAVSTPFTIYPMEYYYNGQARLYTLPLWNRFESGAAPGFEPALLDSQVKELAGSHENVYLVLSYNQGYERQIRDYFIGHYPTLLKKELSKGLTLYKFKVGGYGKPVELTPETLN